METKKEITINELAGTVTKLSGGVDGLTGRVDELSGKVNGLTGTVNELSGTVDRLAGMMQRGFEVAQKRAEATDDKIDQILTGQDHILDRLTKLETDNIVGAEASRRQGDKLEDHEERIVVVEGKLGVEVVG